MTKRYNFPRLRENFSRIIEILTPDTLDLSPISGNSIQATWSSVYNADSYTLERDTNADFSTSVNIYIGIATTFIDVGLELDTTYYYRVKATRITYVDSGWRDNSATTETPESNDTDFLAFSFPEQSGAATINTGAHTIDIEVVSGTGVTALAAIFTLSLGATVKVGAISQVSGATPNDFSSPVTYAVTAEDNSTNQNWTVTVTVASSSETANVITQGYGDRCRISWQVTGDIPSTFLVERSVNAGAYGTVDATYEMADPFTGYKMAGITRNFYYIDDSLSTGNTYKYRIDGTESNTITMAGTVYYVKNGGNDGLDGLSDGNAWETIEKANGNRSAGDLVLFKRTDTFGASGSIIILNKGNGTSDNPIVWGAYDSGNKPILNFNYVVGIQIRDLSYWNFEFIDFRNQVGGSILKIYAVAGDTSDVKFLNCDVDCSSISGFNGGIYFYEEGSSNQKSSIHFIDDVEIAYCTFADGPSESALKIFACRSGCHIHNCYFSDNSSAITLAGGLNHILEYTEIKCGTYGAGSGYNPTGAKAHAQQHWLENVIFRRNLVYNSRAYGLLIDTSKNGLVEYNTCYNGNYGYGAFCQTAQWRIGSHVHEGNTIKNNIFVGSDDGWSGAQRLQISETLTDEIPAGPYQYEATKYELGESPEGQSWHNTFTSYYNCFYEGTGGIIYFRHQLGSNWEYNTHQKFIDGWKSMYLNDEHEDPLFNDVANEDFTLQADSPAIDIGVYGAGFTAPPIDKLYGENVTPNGILQAWDVNNPRRWAETNPGAIFKNGNACQINTAGTYTRIYLHLLTLGKEYYINIDIIDATSGALKFEGSSGTYETWDVTGSKQLHFIADGTIVEFSNDGATNITFTNIFIRPAQSTVLFDISENFESGVWDTNWKLNLKNGGDAAVAIESGTVGSGVYSVKLSHSTKGGDEYNRCEIEPDNYNEYWWFKEYWIGIRIYLKDWNTLPANWNTLIQMHTKPYNNDWDNESGDNAWTLYTNKSGFNSAPYNVLRFHSQVLDDPLTDIPTEGAIGPWSWEIPVPENQWFTVVINWKSSQESDGFIKMWYNDSLMVNQSGANTHYLDCDGDPRFQANSLITGSYKDPLSTDERILYLDDIKIAGDQAYYELIAPPPSTGTSLGSELLDNPGFDSDTIWTKDAGWTIAGGFGVATATEERIFQTFGSIGINCRASVEVVHTSGEYRIRDSGGHASPWQITTQTFIFDTLWDNNFIVESNALNPFTGTIDNASLKQIL
jgi:hypothetical protein